MKLEFKTDDDHLGVCPVCLKGRIPLLISSYGNYFLDTHYNIDGDVCAGSTKKPEAIYRRIKHYG